MYRLSSMSLSSLAKVLKLSPGISWFMLSLLIAAAPAFAQVESTESGWNLLSTLRETLKNALVWIDGLGAIGGLVLILIYIVATVSLVSGAILTLGAGAIFGLWKGAIYAFLGASLGATTAFLVGRYLARNWVAQKIAGNPQFAAFDRAVGKEGFKIVALSRLSPLFPFILLNYFFSLTSVSLKDYLLGFIGMIPGTILYTYLGSAAGNLAALFSGMEGRAKTPAELAFFYMGLAVTVIVTTYVTRLAGKALKESVAGEEERLQNP
jgi:uncharacterized membrane protein YdjX (TVP38/TMEM64 family)